MSIDPDTSPDGSLPEGIVAESAVMQYALRQAQQFATSQLPVLISGATGTGKEVIAQYLHRLRDPQRPYMDVNCAALPGEMIESMLFGHGKGSFTGAHRDQPGLLEAAYGGTVYLDELCSLSLEGQAKLLRVVETMRNRRLGESQNRALSFNLVASVQEDPRHLVKTGELRSDLYFRLAVCRIHLTPLRERPEDIGPLAELFAAGRGKQLAPGAARALRGREWPGNARELFGVIARASIQADQAAISYELLEAAANDTGVYPPEGQEGSPERRELLRLCLAHDWDTRAIAAALQVCRATVYRDLKRHRLGPGRRTLRADSRD